jgi:hypothetical protein
MWWWMRNGGRKVGMGEGGGVGGSIRERIRVMVTVEISSLSPSLSLSLSLGLPSEGSLLSYETPKYSGPRRRITAEMRRSRELGDVEHVMEGTPDDLKQSCFPAEAEAEGAERRTD